MSTIQPQSPTSYGSTIIDGSIWGASLVSRAAVSFISTTNEFAQSIQGIAQPTTATASYEKVGFLVELEQHDPSDYSNPANWITKDLPAISGASMIGGNNQTGRVWGLYGQGGVYAGCDGMALGAELGLDNRGAEQALFDQINSKNVLLMVAGEGPAGTQRPITSFGIMVGGTNLAHNGFGANRNAFVDQNNAPVFFLRDNDGSMLAQITSGGKIKGFLSPRFVNTNGLNPALITPAIQPYEAFIWGDTSKGITYYAFHNGGAIVLWPASSAVALPS